MEDFKSIKRDGMINVIGLFFIFSIILLGNAGAATYNVCPSGCDNASIQDAVDFAVNGDTIDILAGTYSENVIIGKSLNIIGSGESSEVVSATPSTGNVLDISANNVNISSLKVSGGNHGIHLAGSACLISDNLLSGNEVGIFLMDSSNNEIRDNVAELNVHGIINTDSSQNTYRNNVVRNNDNYGIQVFRNSFGNIIKNTTATGNWAGIVLEDSGANILTDNYVSYNEFGIHISFSNGIQINDSLIEYNGNYGIYVPFSNNCQIYNNILNNTNNFYPISNQTYNDWNITISSGENIIGGSSISGNFWASPDGTGFSETCTNADGDGLCDSSYTLQVNNVDSNPLTYSTSAAGEWSKFYGNPDPYYDILYSLKEASDGGYIFLGRNGSEEFWVVKTDLSGNVLWENVLPSPGSTYSVSMDVALDGGYVLIGNSYVGTSDYYLMKIDSLGNYQWSQTYDSGGDDRSTGIKADSDGNYVLIGQVDAGTHGKVWLVKVDSSGNEIWDKTFEDPITTINYESAQIAETHEGGYIFPISAWGESNPESRVIIVDDLGNTLQDRNFGMGFMNDVKQTNDGGYILGGVGPISNDGPYFSLLKVNSYGQKTWQKIYSTVDWAMAHSVELTSDGGYILAGGLWKTTDDDVYIVKTNSLGTKQWDRTMGEDGLYDSASTVIEAPDGGYIIGATTESYGHGGQDAWLVKITGAYTCWDVDSDGYDDVVCGGTDCNDNDPNVNPGSSEVCSDGKDNNCDGTVDETQTCTSFPDVPMTHWAHSYIEYLYINGIVNGYPDGTFLPGNSITRGQFAKMIVNANGIPEYHPPTPTFSDVPSDHWSYGYVEAAVLAGIISGYTDGTFRPSNQVTRAQISAMIARSKGWTYSGGLEDFTDVPPTHWAYDNIMAMKEKGIIGGYPDGTFLPANQATRGQNSKMIAIMMQTP